MATPNKNIVIDSHLFLWMFEHMVPPTMHHTAAGGDDHKQAFQKAAKLYAAILNEGVTEKPPAFFEDAVQVIVAQAVKNAQQKADVQQAEAEADAVKKESEKSLISAFFKPKASKSLTFKAMGKPPFNPHLGYIWFRVVDRKSHAIACIKLVRNLSGNMSLKDAKDKVDTGHWVMISETNLSCFSKDISYLEAEGCEFATYD